MNGRGMLIAWTIRGGRDRARRLHSLLCIMMATTRRIYIIYKHLQIHCPLRSCNSTASRNFLPELLFRDRNGPTTCFKDANIMLKYSYWLSTYTSSFVEITSPSVTFIFRCFFNTFRGNEQINHLTTLTTGLARHSECWNYIKAHINHLKVLVICFRYFT